MPIADGIPQPNLNGFREPYWYVRTKLPWQLDLTISPCVQVDNPDDICPGFLLQHLGKDGERVFKRECPYHGFRWERPGLSQRELEADLSARMYAAQIPAQFERWDLYNFPRRRGKLWQTIKGYTDSGQLTQSLLLKGPYGTGKTSLAVSILKERLKVHGGRGLFVVVPNLFAEIRASFDQEGGGGSAMLQRVMNVPLLVLDDLGAERATEWVQEQLYSILNHRLIHTKPTIVTTNLELADIRDRLGGRTAERLKAYRIIEVGGDNMRDQVA